MRAHIRRRFLAGARQFARLRELRGIIVNLLWAHASVSGGLSRRLHLRANQHQFVNRRRRRQPDAGVFTMRIGAEFQHVAKDEPAPRPFIVRISPRPAATACTLMPQLSATPAAASAVVTACAPGVLRTTRAT